MVNFLLKHSQLHQSKEQILKVNEQNEKKETALHIAVLYQDVDIIERLLQESDCLVNLQDSNGSTCLHYFSKKNNIYRCQKKDVKIFHILLTKYRTICKTPEEIKSLLNTQDTDDNTPLHIVCNNDIDKYKPLLSYLIKNNLYIDLNKQNKKGKTALHLLCQNKNFDLNIAIMNDYIPFDLAFNNHITPMYNLIKKLLPTQLHLPFLFFY